jgi:ATP-dependent RNA helicase DeaD
VDAPTGRSQHALYVVPEDPGAATAFLELAVERAGEPGAVLILTGDVESAVSLAGVVVGMRPELPVVAATTTARGKRVVRGAAVVIGTPAVVLGLVRATALKLDAIRTLVVAWADLADPDLEALMAEVPKDAARTIVVEAGGPAIETFIERYARRPRRVGGDESLESPTEQPVVASAIKYVTTAAASRPAALRRVLDEIDPPSVVVRVRTEASERAARAVLRVLGFGADDTTVRVSRGGAGGETAQLVILYDAPLDTAELQAATAGAVVHVVALVQPRELARLRTLAPVAPLTLSGPAARARTREAALRDELRAALAEGIPARELLSLEPLLAEFDGIEVAAAALHLLDRARSTVVVAAPPPALVVASPAAPPRERQARAPIERQARAPIERDDRAPREDRGPREERSPRPSRDDRPPRTFGDRRPAGRDDRPPRSRDDRPAGKRSFGAPAGRGPRPFKGRDERPSQGGTGRPRPAGGPPSADKRSGPPRNEWADRGERLTHSRRPAPRGRGRPPERGQ